MEIDASATTSNPIIQVQAASPIKAATDQRSGPLLAAGSQSPYAQPSSEQGFCQPSYSPCPPLVYIQEGYPVYLQYQNPPLGYHQSPSEAQPLQAFYQPPPSGPYPPQLFHGTSNQIVPDNKSHIYHQIVHNVGYGANGVPQMDLETSSWITQGFPDPYAPVPVPQTPAPTPEASAPFQSVAATSSRDPDSPFLDNPYMPPKTPSLNPTDHILEDPSIGISIASANDDVDELNESVIILPEAPTAVHKHSEPPPPPPTHDHVLLAL